jgi:hypothetical protein
LLVGFFRPTLQVNRAKSTRISWVPLKDDAGTTRMVRKVVQGTVAPRLAKVSTVVKPMPDEAPVTRTFFPLGSALIFKRSREVSVPV